MGKLTWLATLAALAVPLAAESMELGVEDFAAVALDALTVTGLPPALAVLGGAICGFAMLRPAA
ncbi:hypothetical protein [Rubrimonas sp.]|uniref:hypothetical protein n=1 Tax=Rubrimonas sp. TaxID=2036015 RepID=UPI002FDE3085